jgi:hypothetical protein
VSSGIKRKKRPDLRFSPHLALAGNDRLVHLNPLPLGTLFIESEIHKFIIFGCDNDLKIIIRNIFSF